MSRHTDQHQKLFAGYDQGVHSLPAEVVEHRTALTNLAAFAIDNPWPAALQSYREAVTTAAFNAKELPSVKPLIAAKAELDARQTAAGVIRDETERVSNALTSTIMQTADEIVVEHLRPAHEQLFEDVSRCSCALEHYDIDDELELLVAPQPVREAASELAVLAQRYSVLRSARDHLGLLVKATGDLNDRHIEIRNLHEVWGQLGSWTGTSAPPWPTAPRQRLLWLHRSDAEPWMPTTDEQNAAGTANVAWNAERQAKELARGAKARQNNGPLVAR